MFRAVFLNLTPRRRETCSSSLGNMYIYTYINIYTYSELRHCFRTDKAYLYPWWFLHVPRETNCMYVCIYIHTCICIYAYIYFSTSWSADLFSLYSEKFEFVTSLTRVTYLSHLSSGWIYILLSCSAICLSSFNSTTRKENPVFCIFTVQNSIWERSLSVKRWSVFHFRIFWTR